MFESVPMYPGDPILSLVEEFNRDPREEKINLGIGLYYDEYGNVPVLRSVKAAMKRIMDDAAPMVYMPMGGSARFAALTQQLLLGANHQAIVERRVATIQTLGGSGALRIGASFIHQYLPHSAIWVSNPTWGNHTAIFEDVGFTVHQYPYFDKQTCGVDFDGMMRTLVTLPEQSVVLLHPCCHNPTGADLTNAQWDQVINVVEKNGLIPFMDIAYQGFAEGLDEDAYAIRAMANRNITFFLSNSYSKNFSIYGSRTGGLSVFCRNDEEAVRVGSQLQSLVRRNYSSPPAYGAQIVEIVLGDPLLKASWEDDVAVMRERIASMRFRIVKGLADVLPNNDFSYFTTQRGMFSYTGFSPAQVKALKDEHAIYLVGNGRMCLTGLNSRTVDRVAEAFAAVQ